MRPTNIFAAVIFLLMVLSISTPATAQFLPGNAPEGIYPVVGPYQNPIALSLVENGGTIAVRVQMAQTLPCVAGYTAFVTLERQLPDGSWVSEWPVIPVQLGRFGREAADRTARTAAVFNTNSGTLQPGNYRLKSVPWLYSSVGEKCNVSQYFTHIETPYLRVGGGTIPGLSSVGKTSIAALNSGRLEFLADLKTRTRLTIFQEYGSDRVASVSEDYQPGTQTIRTNVPLGFHPVLPIKVHMLNLETGDSTVATLFEPSPNVRLRASEDAPPEWQ